MFAARNAMFASPGPVRYGATGAGASGASTAMSWTHTPQPNDNLVIVGISSYSLSAAPGNPTYGGTSMGSAYIQLNVESDDLWMYLWALKVTPSGGAKTVQCTNNSGYNCGNSLSYSNVGAIGSASDGQASGTSISLTPGANTGGITVIIGATFSAATQTFSTEVPAINSRWVKNGVSGTCEGGMLGDVISPLSTTAVGFSVSSSSGLGLGVLRLLPI
jgi:hypothetical protein